MHRALQIQEILLNIFDHCRPSILGSPSALAALARTCRAFKEPALDVLWERLEDPSPIARCLPEACHQLTSRTGNKYFAFRKSLTGTERETLQSYTFRVRYLRNTWPTLDWNFLKTFLFCPFSGTLFPNLRDLYCDTSRFDILQLELLNMPFPSLVSFGVDLDRFDQDLLYVFRNGLRLFSNRSPNIRRPCISLECMDLPEVLPSQLLSSCIRGWQNLETVICGSSALEMDALAHLSHFSTLTQLCFIVSDKIPQQIAPPISPVSFVNLHHLKLYSETLDPISQLLSQIRLHAITTFAALIDNYPSKSDISFFWHSIQTSCIGQTVEELHLYQRVITPDDIDLGSWPELEFKDLQPCMAYTHLRHFNINIEWDVLLTSSDVLTLTSAWTRLEHLAINQDYGWNTIEGGIVPNELRQLLQTRPSLNSVALAINAQGCTECPTPSAENLRTSSTLPRKVSINVLDSIIRQESIPPLAEFFATITDLTILSGIEYNGMQYKNDWDKVDRLSKEAIRRR